MSAADDDKMMSNLAIAALTAVFSLFVVCGQSHSRPNPQATSQQVNLVLEAWVVRSEQDWPKGVVLSVAVRNTGKSPASLVIPRDGSDYGWRTPVIGVSAIKEWEEPHIYYEESPPVRPKRQSHPLKPPHEHMMRCGNYSSLMRNDIFSLAPGKTKHLFDRPIGGEKGSRWRFVAYYVNDPGMKWEDGPHGVDEPGARMLLKKTDKCSLRSNEVIFTFR